jgi:hypothetical protein
LSVALFLTAAALISVGTVVISSDWVRRGRGWPELRILPRLALHARYSRGQMLSQMIEREYPGQGVVVLKGGDHGSKAAAEKHFK